ncbi:MAG: hypothetical protein RR540_02660 [Oscillospiraceae bacterium]
MVYKNKVSMPSLILGIVGVVFSIVVPIVTYACSIPGLIIGLRDKKRAYRAKAGISLNIVALAIAFINSLFAVVIGIKMYFKEKKSK